MEFKDKVKYLRESRNMTQEDLANALGVTDGAVSSWESGRAEPRMGKVQALAGLFRVTVSDLIDDKKETPTSEDAGAFDFITDDAMWDAVNRLARAYAVLPPEDRTKIIGHAEWLLAQRDKQEPQPPQP